MESLPILYDESISIPDVDVMLITHFHNDHCAAVPWVVGKTDFRGRIFMTHPTKAIYHHVLKDYIQVLRRHSEEPLYSEEDLDKSMRCIEVIDFHQSIDVNGIKVGSWMTLAAPVPSRMPQPLPLLTACAGDCLHGRARPRGSDVPRGHRRPSRSVHRRLQPPVRPTHARRRGPGHPSTHRDC